MHAPSSGPRRVPFYKNPFNQAAAAAAVVSAILSPLIAPGRDHEKIGGAGGSAGSGKTDPALSRLARFYSDIKAHIPNLNTYESSQGHAKAEQSLLGFTGFLDSKGRFDLGNSAREQVANVLTPVYLGFKNTERLKREVTIEMPAVFAPSFDQFAPLNRKVENDFRKYIRNELSRKLKAEVLFGDNTRAAFEKSYGQVLTPQWKLVKGSVKASASQEAGTAESIVNPDKQNQTLAMERAKVGRLIALDEIKKFGIKADAKLISVAAQELKPTSSEMTELKAISLKHYGSQSLESVFKLHKDYNNGKISLPAEKNALDRIISAKRFMRINVTFEGQIESVRAVGLPITLPLIIGLASLGRRRRPKETDISKSGSQKDIDREKRDPNKNVPSQVRTYEFDPASITVTERRDVLINDIAKNWKADLHGNETTHITAEHSLSEKVRRSVAAKYAFTYQNMATDMIRNYDRFDSFDERRVSLANKILRAWEQYDNQNRRLNGEHPQDYFNDEHQKRQAFVHAHELLQIVREKVEGNLPFTSVDTILEQRIKKLQREAE